jgi:hypothetical protein
MRGRKHLQVRGVVDLPEEEVLEGNEDGAVQMCVFLQVHIPYPKLTIKVNRSDISPSRRILHEPVVPYSYPIGAGTDEEGDPHRTG